MNPIQLKLEQVYKEYLEYKTFVEADKRTLEDLRKEVSDKVGQDVENSTDAMFEIMGEKRIMDIDLYQLGIKFYHYFQAYQDLAEIPQEIIEQAKLIEVKQTFTVKNGKKEIVDKEHYDLTKKQFNEAIEQQKVEQEKILKERLDMNEDSFEQELRS